MMDETLDSVTGIDTEDMEEEIQKEVNKVRRILLNLSSFSSLYNTNFFRLRLSKK